MPCLETDTETTSLDTKTGRWLLDVLQVVGAPGGHVITRDVITDQHGELVLNVPAYRGRFRLSMFAEPPDFENISLRKIPIVARQRPYTLHGSRIKAKTLFQQFIAAGPHVWVTARVRPENRGISQNEMAAWFRDYTRAIKTNPVPQCLRRLTERS